MSTSHNDTTNNGEKKKYVVLHDNPPLAGKQYFLMSKVSPETRQRGNIHGLKLHDVVGSEDEARRLAEYYHTLDSDFDIFVGKVGHWLPFFFEDTNIEAVYADERLTELVRSHRESVTDKSKWRQKVDQHVEELKHAYTPEGQEELAKRKESAASVLFRIKQVQSVIDKRREELSLLEQRLDRDYSTEEVDAVRYLPMQVPVPSDMEYKPLPGEDEA